MALTKYDIVEHIQASIGFPRIQSVEITESLLELIKSSLESGDAMLLVMMSWSPVLANSV